MDVAEAVKITTSVARFLENTKRRRAALQLYKELVTLLEFIKQEFNLSKPTLNDKTRKILDEWTISAFVSLAQVNLHLGEYNESKTYAELALAKSRETGSKETEKLCHRIICLCLAFGCSQHDRDTVCLKEMLSVIKESGDTESEATACYLLAMRQLKLVKWKRQQSF